MIQNWKHKLKYICGVLVLLLCFLTGCTSTTDSMTGGTDKDTQQAAASLEETGSYT